MESVPSKSKKKKGDGVLARSGRTAGWLLPASHFTPTLSDRRVRVGWESACHDHTAVHLFRAIVPAKLKTQKHGAETFVFSREAAGVARRQQDKSGGSNRRRQQWSSPISRGGQSEAAAAATTQANGRCPEQGGRINGSCSIAATLPQQLLAAGAASTGWSSSACAFLCACSTHRTLSEDGSLRVTTTP